MTSAGCPMRSRRRSELEVEAPAQDKIIVAGAGRDWPTAQEAVLKLREGAHVPAEAHHLEQLLHGHLAAIDELDASVRARGRRACRRPRARRGCSAREARRRDDARPDGAPVVDIVRFHLLTLARRGCPRRRSRTRSGASPARVGRGGRRAVSVLIVSNPADAGVVDAIALLERREGVVAGARGVVPRPHPRAGRDAQPRRRSQLPSTPGCASTRRMRWPLPIARTRGSRAGDAPMLCGVPVGLKDLYAVAGKPLTASSRLLADVPERSCDAWARLEAAGNGAARPPAHARVRRGRDDRPGRQPLGARPLGRRLERRLGRRARRADDAGRDRHGHGRLAAHPVGVFAAPRRSSRPAARCRCAGSCRSLRPSTTPGRWRGASRTASRCSPRWPGRRPPAAARRRSAASPSRRGSASSSSTPTWPTASTRRSLPAGSLGIEVVEVPRPPSSSTSGSRSSTSSAPRCSPTTAASTTGASSTAPRSAASSTTPSAVR